MAIFALITDLEILTPPAWYEEFTTRYLSRPKPHITLIKPRLVKPGEGINLMHRLAEQLEDFKSVFPIQDMAHGIRPFDDGTGLMIGIDNQEVIRFQRALRELIPQELEFYNPAGVNHERDFWPHLTMADQIPQGELPTLMERYNLANLHLNVRIHKILCALPPDFSLEESLKEENFHVMMP